MAWTRVSRAISGPLSLDKLPGSDPDKVNAGLAIKAQVHNVITTFQEEVSKGFARMEIAGGSCGSSWRGRAQ